MKFAAGKYANAICDRCGIRCKYRELRGETIRGKRTGVLVCPTCWDPDHPQNFLPEYVTVDGQALRNARPDTGLAASRQLYPNANWPPYPNTGAQVADERQQVAFRDAQEGAEGGQV